MTTKDAWTEEEESEMRQSLHQKEVLTSQMIEIISTRLNALQTTANNRKYGLECDLKTNSDYCSKKVPPLQELYENRTNNNNKGKVSTAPVSASTQAMMERLFGSDEKTRTRTQVLKKTKLDAQKNDVRRNVRAQLEKQLQGSVDGHITRTVDSFVYGNAEIFDTSSSNSTNITTSPTTTASNNNGSTHPSTISTSNVHINPKLLLLHSLERMRLTQNKKLFKRFLVSDLSCALFEEMFWLCFCHFFQKNSLAQQTELIDRISTKHVKMLTNNVLHANLDFICRMYPYVVASAITWGFHYVFPGSRHLYSLEFKNEVFVFVSQVLLGVSFAPICIHATRKQLFPEDVIEDANSSDLDAATNESTDLPQDQINNNSPRNVNDNGKPFFTPTDFMLPPLPGTSNTNPLPKSLSESCLKKPNDKIDPHDNECTIEKILKKPLYEEDKRKRQPARNHQLRGFFNTSQLSPLLNEYFGKSSGTGTGETTLKSVKKPCFLLRTTPFPNCPVGGEENYHQYYDKRKTVRNYTLENSKQHAKYFKEIHKLQQNAKRELEMLNETRSIVLSSGKKALQAYCTVLISKRNSREDQENASGGLILSQSSPSLAPATAAATTTTATTTTAITTTTTTTTGSPSSTTAAIGAAAASGAASITPVAVATKARQQPL